MTTDKLIDINYLDKQIDQLEKHRNLIMAYINTFKGDYRKISITEPSGFQLTVEGKIILLNELLPFDETIKKYLADLSDLISKKKKEFYES